MQDDPPPGYPLDLRDQSKIACLPGSPLGDFELAAARVVARRTGERVIIQDDGTGSRVADLRVENSDSTVSFVEITADLDSSYGAMHAAINGQGWETNRPALTRTWWLTLSGACNVKQLLRSIEQILADMAAAGELYEQASDSLDPNDGVGVRRLVRLGVVGLSSRACRPGESGTVHLRPDGITGPTVIDWAVVSSWIDTTLHSAKLADVRRKLAKTCAIQRHLFLGVTFTSPGEVYFALSLDERGLPQTTPQLPDEITHLWLSQVPMLGRCIAWFPALGWHDVAYHWATD
jgi:hypothetical protein